MTHTRSRWLDKHSPNGDTLPPHDQEAEAGALACIFLTDESQASAFTNQLSPDHFYDHRHKVIFDAIKQSGHFDQIAIDRFLRDRGLMENAGGMDYFARLPDAAPSAANFPAFLERLQEKSVRRAATRDGSQFLRTVNDPSATTKAIAEAASRMAQAYGRTGGLPEIQDVLDFSRSVSNRPAELVHGVLHKASKLVLGGGSKTFKTWTLTDLAISVAFGEPWLSFKVDSGKVLFLNFEIQPDFFRDRILAVQNAKSIKARPGRLDVWNLRGHATCYRELFPKILERVRSAKYALIILDPIYKIYGATDENSAGAVAQLLNALEMLTVETGAAVAFGAHYSKGNQAGRESIDRISGSGVFARDPDTILNFTRHEVQDAFTVEATLRNFKPVEPFVVRWDFPLMRRANDLDPANLKQAGGRPKIYTVERLLKALNGRKLTSQKWLEKSSSETGISKTRFFALLEEAKANPNLHQTKAGQWFYEFEANP